MVSKLIALKKEAYAKLLALKRPGQSFSELVMELTRPRGQLDEFIGMWTDEQADRIGKSILQVRKDLDKSFRRRQRVLFGH